MIDPQIMVSGHRCMPYGSSRYKNSVPLSLSIFISEILGLGNARSANEELTRRVAEREGRRIRRMRAREKNNSGTSHVEGMSSDDEVTEIEASASRLQRGN